MLIVPGKDELLIVLCKLLFSHEDKQPSKIPWINEWILILVEEHATSDRAIKVKGTPSACLSITTDNLDLTTFAVTCLDDKSI